jgi:AcrR family transcriptional regulator
MERARRQMEGARRKIDEAERNVERELERAGRDAERASGPVWSRPEPGSRRARFTRDEIAEAALAIADSEGIDAVSMRRVANELGAGTMTLYHYVRTKDELLALMDNAIMGELLIPDDEMPSDWREGLTQIARRSRATFDRHPWLMEGRLADSQIGPNAIRHMEQSVAAVAGLGDFATKMEIVHLIDAYVYGYAIHSRPPGPSEPVAREEWAEQAFAYIDAEVATGEYPHLSELMPPGGMAELWTSVEDSASDDERFERGLKRVLDGIEHDLKPS